MLAAMTRTPAAVPSTVMSAFPEPCALTVTVLHAEENGLLGEGWA